MRSMLLGLAILATLAVGCAAPEAASDEDSEAEWNGEPIAFRYTGPDEGFDAARAAAAQWVAVCGVSISVERDQGSVPLRQVPEAELAPTGKIAVTYHDTATRHLVRIDFTDFDGIDRTPAEVRAYRVPMLAHEMGHALGKGHSADPADIMAKKLAVDAVVQTIDCP